MKQLIIWFYCLNLWDASVIVLGATALLVLLCKKGNYRPLIKGFLLFLLVVWTVAVLHYTLWSRTPSAAHSVSLLPLQSYLDVLHGANPELLRSNYMNVLLFFPAGVLFAALLAETRLPTVCIVLGFILLCVFSIIIEAVQFRHGLGVAETDDVIHNTLGSIIGFYSFAILNQHIRM